MSNTRLTKKQQEILDSYVKNGTYRGAARELDLDRMYVKDVVQKVERLGMAPWLSDGAMIPEHLRMAKTTVHYKDGEVKNEWRRLEPRYEILQDVVNGLCEKVRGKGRVHVRRPRKTDTDEVLFELDIYDAHVGMYADERETLDKDYDCDIAAKRMIEAAEGICSRANRPSKVVVVFGGDMLHADNRGNTTSSESSSHVMDVDTRYSRVVSYIISACRDVVQIAASIGAEVEVVVLEGNHSWHSEVWLAQVLHAYYSECPNVTVKICASPRKHMVFGDNLLVWTHGDKVKADNWAKIIAAEFPKQWGLTRFRHLKCGHIHHQKTLAPVIVDEQAGLLVEFLPALCPTDAWHASSGYVGSQKGAVGFEYHKSMGCMTRFFHAVG